MNLELEAVKAFGGNYPERYDVGFIFCGERILRCGFNWKVEELSHHKGIDLFNEYVKADKKLLAKESKVIESNLLWNKSDEYIVCTAKNSLTKCWTVGDKYKIKEGGIGCYITDDRGRGRFKGELAGALFIGQPKPQPKESNMKPVGGKPFSITSNHVNGKAGDVTHYNQKPLKPADFGAIKDIEPAFTQEMSDNGELPSVGMEVMIKNKCDAHPQFKKALIKYMGDLVIYSYVENGERCDSNVNLVFRPIDTRTDKEKAIDDMSKRVSVNKECLSVIYDEWSGNNE